MGHRHGTQRKVDQNLASSDATDLSTSGDKNEPQHVNSGRKAKSKAASSRSQTPPLPSPSTPAAGSQNHNQTQGQVKLNQNQNHVQNQPQGAIATPPPPPSTPATEAKRKSVQFSADTQDALNKHKEDANKRAWSVLEPSSNGVQRKVTDDYEVLRKLGQGSYGKVRLGKSKATGEQVAVKSVLKKNMRRLQTLRREISIMRKVRHPNIIRLIDVYEDDAFLHIVMELCTGGELFDKIIQAGHYTEKDARELIYQMLDAVQYLHGMHIAHRDLKPENFLFASKERDAPLKLIDFGLSRFYQDNLWMRTRAGTPYYLAPEVLEKRYDKKCDVWSCGVLLYILLCGYPPFYGDNEKQIYAMIRKGVFDFPDLEWHSVSSTAKDLIAKMLDLDSQSRLTALEALEHPWFQGMPPPHRPGLLTGSSTSSSSAISSEHKAKSQPTTATNQQSSATATTDGTAAAAAAAAAPPSPPPPPPPPPAERMPTPPSPPPRSNAESSLHDTTPVTSMDNSRNNIPSSGEALGETETVPANQAAQVDVQSLDTSEVSSPPSPPARAPPSPKHLHGQPSYISNDDDDGEVDALSRSLDHTVVERLRSFAASNKMKRAALGVIVRYLNRKEINALRSQFERFDEDGNGFVTGNELAQAMRRVGLDPSEDEVENLLVALDEDHNGKIDYEEFLAASMDRHVYLRQELLETAFHYFDTANKGCITVQDLEARLGDEDASLVQHILKSWDADRDNLINFEEFSKMMNEG